MKTFLLAAAFIFGTSFVYAQDEETPAPAQTKMYVGLTGGVALPVGNFHSTSIKNDHAGYAGTGYNLAAIAGLGITKSFGIGGKFYYAKNDVDKNFYADDTSKLTISPWSYYALMVGPSFSDLISPSFNMNYKFLFGGGIASSPKAKNGDEVVLPRYYSDIKLTWSVSAELQYLFSKDKKWAAVAEIGYVDMKPEFMIDDEFHKQAIKAVHINLGIAYQLK